MLSIPTESLQDIINEIKQKPNTDVYLKLKLKCADSLENQAIIVDNFLSIENLSSLVTLIRTVPQLALDIANWCQSKSINLNKHGFLVRKFLPHLRLLAETSLRLQGSLEDFFSSEEKFLSLLTIRHEDVACAYFACLQGLWAFYTSDQNYASVKFTYAMARLNNNALAHLYRAHALFALSKDNKNNYRLAKDDFSRAIDLYQQNADPDLYFNRGCCFECLSQDEKACADYNKALQINSKFIMAYFYLARLHIRNGAFNDANLTLEKLLMQINPSINLYEQVRTIIKELCMLSSTTENVAEIKKKILRTLDSFREAIANLICHGFCRH